MGTNDTVNYPLENISVTEAIRKRPAMYVGDLRNPLIASWIVAWCFSGAPKGSTGVVKHVAEDFVYVSWKSPMGGPVMGNWEEWLTNQHLNAFVNARPGTVERGDGALVRGGWPLVAGLTNTLELLCITRKATYGILYERGVAQGDVEVIDAGDPAFNETGFQIDFHVELSGVIPNTALDWQWLREWASKVSDHVTIDLGN